MSEELGAAFFHFDTDIESVVERIVAGLTAVETETSATRGGGINLGLTESVGRELQQIRQQAIETAGAVRTAFTEAARSVQAAPATFQSPTGRSLGVELAAVRDQAARQQAELLRRTSIAAPGAAIDYRALARDERAQMEQAFRQEFNTAKSQIQGIRGQGVVPALGVGRLRSLSDETYGSLLGPQQARPTLAPTFVAPPPTNAQSELDALIAVEEKFPQLTAQSVDGFARQSKAMLDKAAAAQGLIDKLAVLVGLERDLTNAATGASAGLGLQTGKLAAAAPKRTPVVAGVSTETEDQFAAAGNAAKATGPLTADTLRRQFTNLATLSPAGPARQAQVAALDAKLAPGGEFDQLLTQVTRGGKSTELGFSEFLQTVAKRKNLELALQEKQAFELNERDTMNGLLQQINAGTASFLHGSSSIVKTTSGDYFKTTQGGLGAVGLNSTQLAYQQQRADELALQEEQRAQKLAERQATLLSSQATLSPQQSFLGGLTQRGFFNSRQGVDASLSGLAGTAGTLVKYGVLGSLTGGALFGLSDFFREAKDYADSLVDLNNAYVNLQDGTSKANDVSIQFIGTLSELSRVAGSNVGSAMDSAARSIRAFGDEANGSPAKLQQIGQSGALASTQLSVIANKPLRDATGDIVSIGQSFGLRSNQLPLINDAIANARNLGGAPAEISQGLANFAEAANQAGYTVTQAASILSAVIAKTDESGQAAATRLSRIFQIFQGQSGQKTLIGLGVDVTQSVKSQIEQLAHILPALGSSDRAAAIGKLGGTANLREFLPLINDNKRIQANFANAINNPGQGEAYYEQQISSFAGLVKRITGDLKNLEIGLINADIFAPLAAGLKVLEPLLHTLSQLISLYDRLPAAAKTGIAVLLEFVVAAKALQAINFTHGLQALTSSVSGSRVGQALRSGGGLGSNANFARIEGAALATTKFGDARLQAAVAGDSRLLSAGNAALASGAYRAGGLLESVNSVPFVGAAVRGASSGLALAGRAALSLINPITVGIVGLTALGELHDSAQKLHLAMDQGAAGLESLNSAQSSTDFAAAASQLGSASHSARAAGGGVFGSIFNFLTGGSATDAANNFKRQASYAAQTADALKAEDSTLALAHSVDIFGTNATKTSDDISRGLQILQANGVSATTQLNLVASALGLIGTKPGDRPKTPFPIEHVAADITGSTFGVSHAAVYSALNGDIIGSSPGFGDSGPPDLKRGDLADTLKNASRQKVNDAIKNTLAGFGLQPGQNLTDLTPQQLDQVAQAGVNALGIDFSQSKQPKFIAAAAKVKAEIKRRLLIDIASLVGSEQASTTALPNDSLSDKDVITKLAQLQLAPDVASTVPKTDPTGAVAVGKYKDKLDALLLLKAKAANKNIEALNLAIDAANADYVNTYITYHDQLAAGQERNAPNFAAAQKILLANATSDVKVAIDAPAALAQIIASLSQDDVDKIQHELDVNAALKKAVAEAAAKRLAAWNSIPKSILRNDPDAAAAYNADKVAAAAASAAAGAATGQANNFKKASQATAAKFTSAQIAAMKEAAAAAPDDAVAQAQAEIDAASADLKAAGGDVQKYTDAEKRLNQAILSKKQAIADLKSAQDAAAASESYGPVSDATAAMQQAKDSLDATTQGTAAYYRALAAYNQSKRALAQAVIAAQATSDLLAGDFTDPVYQATVKLRTAQRTLRYDRTHGADQGQINTDTLDVNQSRSDKEKAKFDQRLQDMKTADDLGRISHEKYINYLENEHNRLVNIQHRTRQQQDELDSIDQALKAANQQMTGQWNIGSIRIPTPYEVQRAIKAQSAGVDYLGYKGSVAGGTTIDQGIANGTPIHNDNRSYNVEINGADFARVVAWLQRTLGKQATTRGGTKPRKV